MGIRNSFTMAGAITIAALSLPAFARESVAATTEFSAQPVAVQPQAKKNVGQRSRPAARPARTAPVQRAAPRPVVRTAPVQHSAPQRVQTQPRVQENVGVPANPPRVVAPVTAGPRVIAVPRQGNRTFTPRGANSTVVRAARIRSVPAQGAGRTTIQGRNYSVWRSNYRVRRGNGWRTFVALGALGTIAIGASQYYPYAYIQAPENYCDGRTEDGCQLVFEDVETVEGDVIGQCVAYCPWQQ